MESSEDGKHVPNPLPPYEQPPGQPQQSAYDQSPGYGHQPHFQPAMYPEPSGSATVLILGILGLVFCQVLAPIAWYMGNKELAAIDAGHRDPTNREHANIGRILGIIGTAIIALGLLFFVLWIVFAFLGIAAAIVGSSAALGVAAF